MEGKGALWDCETLVNIMVITSLKRFYTTATKHKNANLLFSNHDY